jgi:hypothetical protein
MDENKFMRVYIELISFPDTVYGNKDSFESYKQSVLNKHNISKEDYKEMIDYYNSNPELWEEFFQKAIKYVETRNDTTIVN